MEANAKREIEMFTAVKPYKIAARGTKAPAAISAVANAFSHAAVSFACSLKTRCMDAIADTKNDKEHIKNKIRFMQPCQALSASARASAYNSISLCFSVFSRLAFLNTEGSTQGMCGRLPSNKSSTVRI